MYAFWISLGMVFVAELGDKTQLVALSMAARFRARVVLAGVFVATLTVHLFSVGLGGLAEKCLPRDWISLAAGLAFIGFGLWTLRGDSLDDDPAKRHHRLSPFWIVTVTFFLAELGDKTMLSTVTLATKYNILAVWIGSSLGMVISDGLAIAVGSILGTQLPQRAVKIGAASIFFAFGVWSMVQGARTLPAYAWIMAAHIVGLFILAFLRALKRERAARLKSIAPEPTGAGTREPLASFEP